MHLRAAGRAQARAARTACTPSRRPPARAPARASGQPLGDQHIVCFSGASAASPQAASAADAPHHVPLDTASAVARYAASQPQLRQLLGLSNQAQENITSTSTGSTSVGGLVVHELCGGRINYTWRLEGPNLGVVLKWAPPYVRSVGPSFRLSQDRLAAEAIAQAAAHAASPRHVPALLLHDPAAGVLVQELLASGPPSARRLPIKLSEALQAAAATAATPTLPAAQQTPAAGGHEGLAEPLPGLASELADLLAAYLTRSNSTFAVVSDQEHAARAAALVELNREVVAANVAVVFTDPWDANCPRNRVVATLAHEAARLRSDVAVQHEVDRLRGLYLTRHDALVHNDLTTGNLLVHYPASCDCDGGGPSSSSNSASSSNSSSTDLFLVDWEFATYAPMSYDVGSLLGNLLLSYCASLGAGPSSVGQAARESHGEWLLACVADVWAGLADRLTAQVAQARPEASRQQPAAHSSAQPGSDAWLDELYADSLGYAGCVMARLLIGMHAYPVLAGVADAGRRAACERAALRLAAALLTPAERARRQWGTTARGGVRDGMRAVVADARSMAAAEV